MTCNDVVARRTRLDLEAFLRAGISADLADIIIAALQDGEASKAWSDAEFELGTLEVPS